MNNRGAERRLQILDAGVAIWPNVSARNIGKSLDLSHAAILYHFKSSAALRDAVAQHAVDRMDKRVVAALLVEQHPATSQMDDADRRACLEGLF